MQNVYIETKRTRDTTNTLKVTGSIIQKTEFSFFLVK